MDRIRRSPRPIRWSSSNDLHHSSRRSSLDNHRLVNASLDDLAARGPSPSLPDLPSNPRIDSPRLRISQDPPTFNLHRTPPPQTPCLPPSISSSLSLGRSLLYLLLSPPRSPSSQTPSHFPPPFDHNQTLDPNLPEKSDLPHLPPPHPARSLNPNQPPPSRLRRETRPQISHAPLPSTFSPQGTRWRDLRRHLSSDYLLLLSSSNWRERRRNPDLAPFTSAPLAPPPTLRHPLSSRAMGSSRLRPLGLVFGSNPRRLGTVLPPENLPLRMATLLRAFEPRTRRLQPWNRAERGRVGDWRSGVYTGSSG